MEENNNKPLKRIIKVSLDLMFYIFYVLKMYELLKIFFSTVSVHISVSKELEDCKS